MLGTATVFVFDLLVTAAGLAILAQHIWALRSHFASTSMTTGARLISAGALAACLCMMVLLWTGTQPLAAPLAGLVLMGASLVLFLAAIRASRSARLRFAFDDALPDQLVTLGPYRFIRHPFYASYLLYWLGWAIASWSVWALLPVAIMATLYTIAARHEERLLGTSGMGAAYAHYRQQAGLFWPRF